MLSYERMIIHLKGLLCSQVKSDVSGWSFTWTDLETIYMFIFVLWTLLGSKCSVVFLYWNWSINSYNNCQLIMRYLQFLWHQCVALYWGKCIQPLVKLSFVGTAYDWFRFMCGIVCSFGLYLWMSSRSMLGSHHLDLIWLIVEVIYALWHSLCSGFSCKKNCTMAY